MVTAFSFPSCLWREVVTQLPARDLGPAFPWARSLWVLLPPGPVASPDPRKQALQGPGQLCLLGSDPWPVPGQRALGRPVSPGTVPWLCASGNGGVCVPCPRGPSVGCGRCALAEGARVLALGRAWWGCRLAFRPHSSLTVPYSGPFPCAQMGKLRHGGGWCRAWLAASSCWAAVMGRAWSILESLPLDQGHFLGPPSPPRPSPSPPPRGAHLQAPRLRLAVPCGRLLRAQL